MNTISNSTKIKETDVNWQDLEGIGISKAELERNGDLERLLNGEEVNIISLNMILLGVEIEMDATIRIVEEGNVPMLEIYSIKQE
jgi:hypothetical protein